MYGSSYTCRLFKKAVQQGRSERRGESYFVPYVEPLSDARTMLAGFFNSLLRRRGYDHATDARSSRWVEALQSDDEDFLPIAPKAN